VQRALFDGLAFVLQICCLLALKKILQIFHAVAAGRFVSVHGNAKSTVGYTTDKIKDISTYMQQKWKSYSTHDISSLKYWNLFYLEQAVTAPQCLCYEQ
jgi:hypothetical protein